jgi:hypothetical protein
LYNSHVNIKDGCLVHIFPVVIKRWRDLLKACPEITGLTLWNHMMPVWKVEPDLPISHMQYWFRLYHMTEQ